MNLWNQGVWTAPLGGLPIRWYPANWNLQQRKERERFQAVVKDIPGTVTTSMLYLLDPSQSSIFHLECKAKFALMTGKGRSEREFITHYNYN